MNLFRTQSTSFSARPSLNSRDLFNRRIQAHCYIQRGMKFAEDSVATAQNWRPEYTGPPGGTYACFPTQVSLHISKQRVYAYPVCSIALVRVKEDTFVVCAVSTWEVEIALGDEASTAGNGDLDADWKVISTRSRCGAFDSFRHRLPG